MQLRKYRWSRTYEPSEFELIKLLEQRNIDAKPWEAAAGDTLETRSYSHDARLWCAEGSIVFTVGQTPLTLQAGDALELPAKTSYQAVAGLTGCTVYESPPK